MRNTPLIEGYTIKELATAVGDLRYDVLTEFLNELSEKLKSDSKKDMAGNRVRLATSLLQASHSVMNAKVMISVAWKISERHMNVRSEGNG